MAADFNAGSIEGTLDLDTAPFASGLRKAKMEADDFSRKKVTAKASLDNTELDAKDRLATEKLDRLDHKKVSAKADLDISEAEAKAAILNRTLSKALDAGGLGKAATSPALMVGKLLAMAGAFMSVAAAAGPATAVVAGFGAAAGVAFAGAGIALGLFAKMVTSDFAKIQKAIKAGIDLKGPAGVAEQALKHLTTAWHQLQKATGSVGYKVLTTAFTGISAILPKLVPLLRATGDGVNHVLKQVLSLGKTPLFDHFLHTLTGFMHGFLSGAGPVLRSLLSSFMHAFIVLQPLMATLGHGIQMVVQKLHGFTAGGGLKSFVGYVQEVAPKVLGLLTAVVHGLMNLGHGLAPLAGPALTFITGLVHAIGTIHLGPVAAGFAALLHALQPVLPVAAQLINVALKPLGALLGALAHGPVAAIVHGLRGELQPAFKALHSILSSLVHPVAAFLASIANLANPTGIHLVSTLLKTLAGVVHTVAPALGHLAVALESVVDNGIELILPLLPKVAPLLKAMAGGAAAVANALAGILAHKAVAGVLLGIVGAVYGGVKAFRMYQAVTEAVTLAQAAYATAMLGSEAATEAGGLSLAIFRARLIAVKVAQFAVAAASKAWAAAQWVLNAALDANPIGIIIVAIGALVAGLIYAYKHSETFRNIVNGAFHAVASVARTVFNWLKNAVGDVINFIRDHWKMLVAIFLGPLGIVVALVISHWDQIRNYTVNLISNLVSWFSNGWAHLVSMTSNFISNVVQFFAQLPGKIGNFVGNMMNAGQNLMTGIWHGLENVWNNIWSWVSGLPSKIVNIFSNIGGQISGSIHSAISSAVSSLPGPLAKIAHGLGLATGGVTTGIMQATIGDNPGGREAVIPLDKYDIPAKGDTARTQAALLAAASASNAKTDSLLASMVAVLQALLSKTGSPEDLAAAVGAHTTATMKQVVQMQRAAGK